MPPEHKFVVKCSDVVRLDDFTQHQTKDTGTVIAPTFFGRVPVCASNGVNQAARMYMHLSFLANGKTALDYPELPDTAPGYATRTAMTAG